MNIQTKTSTGVGRIVSLLVLFIGLLLAMVVAFISFWPGMEASLFDTSTTAEATLDGVTCPRVLTADESGVIQATLDNPLDRPITLLVRTRISEGRVTLIRQFSHLVDLQPGESDTLSWDVSADDAVYNRVIMARVFVTRNPPLPSRQRLCGTMVVPVSGMSGNQLLTAAIIASLLGIGAGGVSLVWSERPFVAQKRFWAQAVGALVALVLLNMILSLLGIWWAGVLLSITLLLYAAVMIERFLSHR